MEEGLHRVVVALGDGLELVVVALGALHGQAEQAGSHDLLTGLERVVPVDADLVRIAVRLAGAILAVAQEVGGLEQSPDLRRHRIAGRPAGQLVAGQLLMDPPVEGLIPPDGGDHPVPVPMGQRPVGIGVEVAVRVGIPGGIQPMLRPALGEGRPREVALQPAPRGGRVPGRLGVESLDLLGRRWQAGHHQGQPAEAAGGVGQRAQAQAPGGKPGLEEPVHRGEVGDRGSTGTAGLEDCRRRRHRRGQRLEGPVGACPLEERRLRPRDRSRRRHRRRGGGARTNRSRIGLSQQGHRHHSGSAAPNEPCPPPAAQPAAGRQGWQDRAHGDGGTGFHRSPAWTIVVRPRWAPPAVAPGSTRWGLEPTRGWRGG